MRNFSASALLWAGLFCFYAYEAGAVCKEEGREIVYVQVEDYVCRIERSRGEMSQPLHLPEKRKIIVLLEGYKAQLTTDERNALKRTLFEEGTIVANVACALGPFWVDWKDLPDSEAYGEMLGRGTAQCVRRSRIQVSP